jgi:hypothetical protein
LAFPEPCDRAAGGGLDELGEPGDCAKAAVTMTALSAVDIISFFNMRVSSSIAPMFHQAQRAITVRRSRSLER